MEEEVPNVTGHVSRLEVWWGHQGSVLSQMVSRGRRFKLEGGKGGVEALGEIKAQWEQVGENFGTYIDDVSLSLRSFYNLSITVYSVAVV
jgi:hypothetical protein